MNKADFKRATNLSRRVASLGFPKAQSTVRAFAYEAPPPSEDKLLSIIKPIVQAHVEALGKPQVEVTPELVKQIVQVMHSLPESDKLEVSKGIRNAQSFIFNKTNYKSHEMMHGGGSGTGSTTNFVNNEVVAGSGTTFTLAFAPVAGSVMLYGNGQFLTPGAGNDYTISGSTITTANSFVAGTVVANYRKP